MKIKNKRLIITILWSVSIITFSGCDLFKNTSQTQKITEDGIYDYNKHLHKTFIEKQFKENWYWLISSPEYDINYMLDTLSPNAYSAEHKGKLKIKVLHKNGVPVGFTSYYMITAVKGDLFILGVDKDQRGKGYGSELLKYSENALVLMGAQVITFVTRVDNPGAQKMYVSCGFEEIFRDEIFVHYRKNV
ncbi:GNAT family N-acetyltransferase [Candidatus Babeliales bacterium]|nr:GNAT family N-acetyltransferase [Candidatus Babeliales bacterium]